MAEWLPDVGAPTVMGILNVTPDSFSDAGSFFSHEKAIAHGRRLARDGAQVVDVGGESTRPGSLPVPIDEEIGRVVPVVAALSSEGIRVSIDTGKPEVMAAAVAAGACCINDVYALMQPGALDVAVELNVPVCLMHMQGTPATMQADPQYDDVVTEVYQFLQNRVEACCQAGLSSERLIVDPGFGFGKTQGHNVALLAALAEFLKLKMPLMVGVSRKAFVRRLSGCDSGADLDRASALVAVLAAERGAQVLRVHDVKTTVEMLRLWSATRDGMSLGLDQNVGMRV